METTTLLVEIDHADELDGEDDVLQAATILTLQRLRRTKPDGIDMSQLVDTQRDIEDTLGIYGCALSPKIDVDVDWEPE